MKKHDHLDGLEHELHASHRSRNSRQSRPRHVPISSTLCRTPETRQYLSIREEVYCSLAPRVAGTACPRRSFWLTDTAPQSGLFRHSRIDSCSRDWHEHRSVQRHRSCGPASAPYPDANRLIWLASYSTDELSEHDNLVSRVDYSNWNDQSRTMESTAAYGNQDLAMMYRGLPTQERVASIAGDFWSLAGSTGISRKTLSRRVNRMQSSFRMHSLNVDSMAIRTFWDKPSVLMVSPIRSLEFYRAAFNFCSRSNTPTEMNHETSTLLLRSRRPSCACPMPVLAHGNRSSRRFGPTPYYVSVIGRLRARRLSRSGTRRNEHFLHPRIAAAIGR